jgi:hypothetical protein
MNTTTVKRKTSIDKVDIVEKGRMSVLKRRKRIPVSKIYWKKGTYKELVEDPFNTGI